MSINFYPKETMSEIMGIMVSNYATEENYHRLKFTMSPDYWEKLEKENENVVVDSKEPIKRFKGIKIEVVDGFQNLTLSCDRS